jgi:hypothetical protein
VAINIAEQLCDTAKRRYALHSEKWRGKSREKMERHTETFGGYKVTGWQEQKQHVWRIRTWPADKDQPEHEYWVIDGKFYEEGVAIPFSYPSRYYSELGQGVDARVTAEEKAAVLHLIGKWKTAGAVVAPNCW